MSNKKELLKKEDIINEMSQRKNITRNRYLIAVTLQTKYYGFNFEQYHSGKPQTRDPLTDKIIRNRLEDEAQTRENKLNQRKTLLINRETKEFLRVDLKDFLEREFYPLLFNYGDIKEIKKYFEPIVYFGYTPEEFKEFEIKTLERLEAENKPRLSDFYEVV